MKLCKQEYYLNLMNKNKEDPKKFWDILPDLLNNKNVQTITSVRDPNTNLLLNRSDSAELLNDYFSSIAEKLVNKLPPSAQTSSNSNTPFTDLSVKFDNYITVDRIAKVLKDFRLVNLLAA